MFNNRKDDDVIVISEEDVTYENADENGDPADAAASTVRDDAARDDLAADDESSRPSGTGRLSEAATPGEAAARTADGTAAAGTTAAGRFGSVRDGADPESVPVDDPAGADGPPFGDQAVTPGESGFTAADDAREAHDDEAHDDTVVADSPSRVTDDGPADRTGNVFGSAPASGTVNGGSTVNGGGTGSAIPMSGATPTDTAATPAGTATPADTATPVTPAAPVTTPAEVDSQWPQIQSLFVDDPQSAVRQAADVTEGAVAALVAAAKNREQTMRDAWQSDSTGTEDLRTALRGYRDLAGRLSALAQEL
jgi:hypothetical protein